MNPPRETLHSPRPLMRQSTTIHLPGSDVPVTLQVVALASPDDVERTEDIVRWDDLPESKEAGWFGHRTLRTEFHVRFID